MELRYVYRRLEDAIGSGIGVAPSPHAKIAARLRFDLRETRDAARVSEIRALCMAAFAGSRSSDASKVSDVVGDSLDEAFNRTFVYLAKDNEEKETADKEDLYAECFRELREIEAQKKLQKEQSGTSDNTK